MESELCDNRDVVGKSKSTERKTLLGCFSYLHQPLMVRLYTYPVTAIEQKNVFMIKDKCAYAYCTYSDAIAFCGGVDINFSISTDVCLINLHNSSYVITKMTYQRIGAVAVFVRGQQEPKLELLGQLIVAGGKSWNEVKDEHNTSYCRPLELSDTFESPFKMPNGNYEWKVTKGVREVQRSFATAVSIANKAYLIGGYCSLEQLKNSQGPTASESIAVYEKERDHWSYGPSMKNARAECGAAALGSNRIFVAGGIDRGRPVSGIEILDLNEKTWTIIKEDPPWPLGPCSGCSVGNVFYATGQLNRNLVSWDSEKEKWSEVILLPHLYEFIVPLENNDIINKFCI